MFFQNILNIPKLTLINIAKRIFHFAGNWYIKWNKNITKQGGNQYEEENVLDQDKVPKPNKKEEEVLDTAEVLFIFSRIYC